MDSSFNECQVSVNSVIAWTCWLAGSGLCLLAGLGVVAPHRGIIGVPLVAFGHARYLASMLSGMDRREQTAFDIGRRSVRQLR